MSKAAKLVINDNRKEVFVSGREIKLSPKEFNILSAIYRIGKRRVVTRVFILESLWEGDTGFDIDVRTVDQHVSRLRAKLNAAFGRRVNLIETVKTHGYRWAHAAGA